MPFYFNPYYKVLLYLMIVVSTAVGLASLDLDNLTSVEKEDVFITETTKLARLFFDIQHKQKLTATCPSERSELASHES